MSTKRAHFGSERYKYQIGDSVQTSRLKGIGSKVYDQSFSTEIFSVADRFKLQGIEQYLIKGGDLHCSEVHFTKLSYSGSFPKEKLNIR